MKQILFEGCGTAISTPFDKSGVNFDEFKRLLENIDKYKKYFDEKAGWDDLDIVRYALSKYDDGSRFHKYAVIFFDEAQDFTKIETDLILKLSVYSKYDLTTREEDSKIPIAFAGDPNQTINPTGFRWGSTQEIFNEFFPHLFVSDFIRK